MQSQVIYNPNVSSISNYGGYIQPRMVKMGSDIPSAKIVADSIKINAATMGEIYKDAKNRWDRNVRYSRLSRVEIATPHNHCLDLSRRVLPSASYERVNTTKTIKKYVMTPIGYIPIVLNIPNEGAIKKLPLQDRKQFKDLVKTTINYALFRECGQGEIYIAKRLKALENQSDRYIKRAARDKRREKSDSIIDKALLNFKYYRRKNNLFENFDENYINRLKTLDMAMQIVNSNPGDSIKSAIDNLINLPGTPGCKDMSYVVCTLNLRPGLDQIKGFLSGNTPGYAHMHSVGLNKSPNGIRAGF